MHFTLRTGADAEGNLLFREADVVSDNGAYNGWGSHAMLVAMNTVTSMYRVPNSRMRCSVVYTNKNYGGSVRGFGNPQATFAVEQQMEELADALGLDPMELRLRNANQSGDVTPQGMEITSCGLSECLELVRERSGWDERRGTMRDRNRGLGAAAYIHVGGGARIYGSDGCGAMVKVDDSGQITLITGASELGQGSETVLAMMVAEEMHVPLEAVHVVNSDTDVKPWDVGVHASRTTFVAGNAARMAAAQAREELLEVASEVLDAPVSDLEIEDGAVSVAGAADRRMDYARLVRRRLLREDGSIIMATAFYDPPTEKQVEHRGNISAAYGFGAHVAEVEVDPGTGMVRILGYWTAHDVGRAINPMSCEGQIEGGTAMGIGLALSEELVIHDGQIAAPNLHDYGLPTAVDVPRIQVDLVETIDPRGPFGAKGVGEGGIIPPPAAIANAIADATGIRPRAYPMRPWKVKGWLDAGERSRVLHSEGASG
jgi:xanthine dehydrogenase molybdenum-binding subunit